MTTTNEIIDNLHDTIKESEHAIHHSKEHIDGVGMEIAQMQRSIIWNQGNIDAAERTLKMIGENEYTKDDIIVRGKHIPQLRERLASMLVGRYARWLKGEIPEFTWGKNQSRPDLKEADEIIDIIRGYKQ